MANGIVLSRMAEQGVHPGVTLNAVNPGPVASDIARDAPSYLSWYAHRCTHGAENEWEERKGRSVIREQVECQGRQHGNAEGNREI